MDPDLIAQLALLTSLYGLGARDNAFTKLPQTLAKWRQGVIDTKQLATEVESWASTAELLRNDLNVAMLPATNFIPLPAECVDHGNRGKRFVDAKDAFEARSPIVVIGEGGAGKSVYMRRLVLSILQYRGEVPRDTARLVALVRLSELVPGYSLLDALCEKLLARKCGKRMPESELRATVSEIMESAKQRQIAILLDCHVLNSVYTIPSEGWSDDTDASPLQYGVEAAAG